MFQFRQLIVDHIKDNKDLYADNIEGNFDDYIQNIKNKGEWSGMVELLVFSSMIDIKIELLTDISNNAPYLTIGYSNCSSAYPHPPPRGGGGGVGVKKFSAYPPPPKIC